MAEVKKPATPAKTTEKTPPAIQLSNLDVKSVSYSELGGMLADLTADEEDEVTGVYLQIEVGSELRVWWIENYEAKKIKTKTGEMATTAKFIQEDGSKAISQTAMLVSACAQFKKPTPIMIQCTGEEGPIGSRYKVLKIVELKQKVVQ